MENKRENLPSWIVTYYNCNRNVIESYDILAYQKEFLKKLKKKSIDKEAFAESLRREMMYHYWARAQYELIMQITDSGRIILSPWIGCSNHKEAEIDVTDYTDFDWKGFAEFCKKKSYRDEIKIDIWDQINFRFNEFVDYCWEYK